ncbi:MAG TPA: carboxypeptidase-like regulatory domain-containing protein [Planctomycetaceae bacterium]|nr:carboxypeptidase-like regulatory domain-containing protein [Planctomycetaceae bacterium]
MKLSVTGLVLGCCLAAVTSGCSKGGLNTPTGTVSGKVTVNGQPLTEGTITFFGENNGDTGAAVLNSDGTYALKYGTGFSVPAGDYRVSVNAGPPASSAPADPKALMATVKVPDGGKPKKVIADKYRDPKTSTLIAVVKPGSNTDVNFELKSN